jgi:hypothetical protein
MAIDLVGWDDMVSGDDISGDDISGDDMVSGADDDLRKLLAVSGDEISGALGGVWGQELALLRRLQQMMMARRGGGAVHPHRRGAVAVRRRAPEHARRFPLGFNSDPTNQIVFNDTRDVKSSPQVTFRAERLIIPSDIAAFFTVVDVKIGNRSQLVAAGEIPATVFSEVGVDANLRCDTAQISMEVTITVRNIDASPHTFRAAILGTAVY